MGRTEMGNHSAKHKISFLIDKHISVFNRLIVRKGDSHPSGPDSISGLGGRGYIKYNGCVGVCGCSFSMGGGCHDFGPWSNGGGGGGVMGG